jgi:LacI family sucrose operon transcriptional repressor
MATLKDGANLAGVTVTTVSRMMNGRCNVSPATRARIEDAMKTLGYHPNELARGLAKKTSNIIGLIVPSAHNYFFSSIIEHVEACASENGCKLLLCVSNLDVQKEKEYFNMLLANKVMGVILASHTQNIDDFIHIDAPLIVIERSPAPHVPCALTDNYNGGYLAGKHLIEKG